MPASVSPELPGEISSNSEKPTVTVVELWSPIEIIAETERWGELWKQMRAIVEFQPFQNLFYFPLKEP